MNHLPTPKNLKNEQILAVREIRVLQFSLFPIDIHYTSICYTFLFLLKIISCYALQMGEWKEDQWKLYALHRTG